MKIAMIGAGYVGLVSGACFADFGHTVVCVDLSKDKIEGLRRGETPIFEPGLDDLVALNVRHNRLSFTTNLEEAAKDADAIFIAVGTPERRGEGHADLTFVYAAARSIAQTIERYVVVVNKSTVPVGTADAVERVIRETRPDADFSVVSNPEFLREGAAIQDFKHPDRVVIGVEDARARKIMEKIYRPLSLNAPPLVFVTRRTSELIKYAANAFLATKVTFINEIADLCEKVGADVQDVARGIGLDRRIGSKFLNVGPGFGGSCFPKDTQALIKTARDYGAPVRIVETVVEVNEARKLAMAQRIRTALGGVTRGKKIALAGLAFKPNTDDMRDAPSLAIVAALMQDGAELHAHDPESMAQAKPLMPGVTFHNDVYAAVTGTDALVIITEWDAFRALDLVRIGNSMRQRILIDLRNIYRSEEPKKAGFTYVALGR